jgi:threonine dehydrogenase-like Zn-dependent dehydrogenase
VQRSDRVYAEAVPIVKSCIKQGRGQVAIADIAIGDPAPADALIRTTLTTICGSDLSLVDVIDAMPAGIPQGHEAVGVIEAVGSDVQQFKAGDRVVASCVTGCGTCTRCVGGELQLCSTFFSPLNVLFGCQSEAFIGRVADTNLAVIPDGMTDRQAIFAADIMSTGFAAIERGRLQRGQTVAIFAQGPVGLCATAAAKYHGAGHIIAVESVPARAAMARRMGADEVISPDGAPEKIRELTRGLGVDLAVEALGKAATFDACLLSIRMGGTVSVVGVFAGQDALRLPISNTFYHHTIVTSYCPGGTARLEHLMGIMARGEVDLTPLFTHDFRLADIANAYDLFRRREDGVIKVAITP